jgi:predicted nuclease of predicted toxin-antitoxin system
MGISPRTVEFLREVGHEANHLHNEGLHQLDDPAILVKAQQEQSVLLTHDLDFGELVAASGAELPSVITFRLRNMRPDNVNRHLRAVINHHQDALKQGAIVTVTEGRIRIRPLPIANTE